MAYESIYNRVAQAVSARPRPAVIGITGAYTSGKTLFAEGFAQFLAARGEGVQIIHYDDFHHPLSLVGWGDGENAEVNAFYARAFNHEKLITDVLRPLRENGVLHKEALCLDWDAGTYTNPVRFDIGADTIVLLEGVLLLCPPVCKWLDYTIFLDVSADEILRRGWLRDALHFGEGIMEKYNTRYIPVHEKHLREDAPRERANIVIDNNDCKHPRIARV